jgi:hypothetical protein
MSYFSRIKMSYPRCSGEDRRDARGMTARQMRRLVRSYRAQGPEGLVSKKRGKIGNHRWPEAFRDHILAIIRGQYADFGPTLA